MVLTRTESTKFNTNSSFREDILKFKDCNTKKKKISGLLKEKKTSIRFYLILEVYGSWGVNGVNIIVL